jgi:hypothetical protein
MKRMKNPLGAYPPGKSTRPSKKKERELLEAELIRESRQSRMV